VSFFGFQQGLKHEAFGSGTGDGGLYDRRARARYDPGGAGSESPADGTTATPATPAKAERKKAKKKEGEEIHGDAETRRLDATK
jgi:hypothetical protein